MSVTGGYILVTRPAEEALGYAEELSAAGFRPLIMPVLKIVPLVFEVVDLALYQGLLFTSVNAVRSFCGRVHDRDLPIYAVGLHTAAEAEKHGFQDVRIAGGGGDELVDLVVQKATDKARPFLHVRGVHVARPIDALLAAQGYSVDVVVVYEARPVEELSAAVLHALAGEEVEAVTFFSKRTAAHFIELAQESGVISELGRIKALCISPAVLKYVQAVSWREAYKSESPHRASMLDLIRRVCVKIS